MTAPKKAWGDAMLSPCGRYRYMLSRVWGPEPLGVVIGINPSTADVELEDATTRKLIGFGKRWGWGGYFLLNPFAFRSTDQRGLLTADDPVGPGNDGAILAALSSDRDESVCPDVVCAWGSAKTTAVRQLLDRRLVSLARFLNAFDALRDRRVLCLGTSADGSPRHPLMLAYDTPLRPYAWPKVRP
jgi:hypothetical protein